MSAADGTPAERTFVRVEVTEEDVYESLRDMVAWSAATGVPWRRERECPVAHALRRAGYLSPSVQTVVVTFSLTPLSTRRECALLGPEVAKRIARFDLDGEMEPFGFWLELPPPAVSR